MLEEIMKRILIVLLACLTIFGVVSCQPRTIFVPYPGGNSDKTETSVVATDFNSMKEAMESATVKNVTLAGFSFDPADVSAQLPIAINGEKTVSGSMYAGDQTATASLVERASITPRALNEDGYTIFTIGNDATVNLVNLTISIADDIANTIRSIFSIDTGSLNADAVKVNTSDTATSAPVLIETTENTSADNVNISNSTNVVVEIPKDGDQAILDKIENDKESAFPYDASTEDELLAALTMYGKARLMADVTITKTDLATDYSLPALNQTANVNLNGYTLFLDLANGLAVPTGYNNTFRNGTLAINDRNNTNIRDTVCAISVLEESTLEFDNVTYNSNLSGIVSEYSDATINIYDSRIFVLGYYGVGTNAGKSPVGIDIDIQRSQIEVGNTVSKLNIPLAAGLTDAVEDHDGTAVFFNVGDSLNIEDSTIIGGAQAVMIRGAVDARISGSTLIGGNAEGSTYASMFTGYLSQTWGTGNIVPYATLVLGNRDTTGYPSSTTCTIENTQLIVAEDSANENRIPLYVGASGHSVNLIIDDSIAVDDIWYYGPNFTVGPEGNQVTRPNTGTDGYRPTNS